MPGAPWGHGLGRFLRFVYLWFCRPLVGDPGRVGSPASGLDPKPSSGPQSGAPSASLYQSPREERVTVQGKVQGPGESEESGGGWKRRRKCCPTPHPQDRAGPNPTLWDPAPRNRVTRPKHRGEGGRDFPGDGPRGSKSSNQGRKVEMAGAAFNLPGASGTRSAGSPIPAPALPPTPKAASPRGKLSPERRQEPFHRALTNSLMQAPKRQPLAGLGPEVSWEGGDCDQ